MKPLYNLNFIVLKAFLVTVLTLGIGEYFGMQDRLSAPFCGLICITPNIIGNFYRGMEQLSGSFLGVIVGLLLANMMGSNPLATALGVAIVFWFCHKFSRQNILVVTFFSVLYEHILVQDTFLLTMGHRLMSVTLGVVVAYLINYAFAVMRHHGIYAWRIHRSFDHAGKFADLFLARLILDGKVCNENLDKLRKLSSQISLLREEMMYYQSMGKWIRKLFGVDQEKIRDLRLLISTWDRTVRSLCELGSLLEDEFVGCLIHCESNSCFGTRVKDSIDKLRKEFFLITQNEQPQFISWKYSDMVEMAENFVCAQTGSKNRLLQFGHLLFSIDLAMRSVYKDRDLVFEALKEKS